MSRTMAGVKALGKALRVKIVVEDEMPAEMQAALLRLVMAELELASRGSSLSGKIQMMEHADADEQQTDEARLTG
jgi:hypothetical protein